MAVPAHDERDFEFAQTFGLEILPVIEGGDVEKAAYTEDGTHINSEFLDGMNKQEAIDKMNEWLEENGVGKKVSYRLRDWLFSRQRYWVNQSQSSIGRTEQSQLSQKKSYHYGCLRQKHQAKRYWRISISKYRGVGQCR